jgi:CHAT domain-containing protein/tetratricopeptide (TPR) repeat protein
LPQPGKIPVPRLTALCLAAWLLAGTAGAQSPEPKPAPLTQEQREKLKERDRFEKEARRLRAEGKLGEAITAAENMLAIDAVLGDVHPDVANSLALLAEMYAARLEFGAAQKARREVVAIRTKLLGAAHWQVTDARMALERVELLARLKPADRGRLEEAERLNRQLVQLYRQGKTREAIPMGQKALAIIKEVLGERHPDYAGTLNGLATLYLSQGEYAKAEPLYLRALEIRKQALGEGHPEYALSLNNLANLYSHRGEYTRAEPLYRQALAIRKQALGERHPAYAASLNDLAGLYQVQRQYAKAEALYRQAVAVRKQALGERHPDYASSLEDLASLYRQQAKYAQAEALYRQALAIRKQALGERHPDYAQTLSDLALMYLWQGMYIQAEPLLRQALEIRKQVLGERHPDYATSQDRLAQLYWLQGEYAQAELLYRQALATYGRMLGERHPYYVHTLSGLAAVYHAQGEYAKAEPLLRQAVDFYKLRAGERSEAYATSLNNLASLYFSQGEVGKAERLYRQVLEVRRQAVGERHPVYARDLYNLAVVYASSDPARAEPLFRQVTEILQQARAERDSVFASSLSNLAFLHQRQGAYAEAERLYRQAMEATKQAMGERHPDYAIIVSNLASLHAKQGDHARAEALYRQTFGVLAECPEGPHRPFDQLAATDLRPSPVSVSCLTRYGSLLEQRLGARPTASQLRSADHAYALALAVRERMRQEVLEQDASKLLLGAETVDLIPGRIGLCQRLFDREGQSADLETAVAVAEQGTARVFLEQLGKARAPAVGRVSPALRARESGLRRQLRELDSRVAREQDRPTDRHDPDQVGPLLDEQTKVEGQLAELIRRMEQEYPQYAALKYPRPCSLAEARACLAPTEVALLFVPGNRRSYLILVEGRPGPGDKANGLAIYRLPPHGDLADGVSRLSERDTFESRVKARAAAKLAYDLLLAPVKERIRGKDLVIVPGGPLAYVPFEALVEDGHFLIEKHRIRYAPSLTALHLVRLWEKTRDQPQRPLWAMADPVYDRADRRVTGGADLAQASKDALAKYLSRTNRGPAAGEPYPRLRFTDQEAQAIRDLLGASGDDVLTGLQASEAAVKAASAKGLLARVRYVHFATHGILGLDTGQPPALVLSLVGNDGARDAEGGVNDGFLRLDEVTRLQLNADLVVLSACETGKGRLYAGEGVTGLARAFLSAGSRGVVCSLWAVDDRETATFMAQLYGGLKDGRAAADALRAAKLAMIRAGKPPVYWAPFILIGE